jgi:hypothetical protein
MNLIANTGIQYLTFPIEISKDDNFRMYFHEWFDVEGKRFKLKIANLFSHQEICVKKCDLLKAVGKLKIITSNIFK